MKHSTPKVFIDLAEYLELKSNVLKVGDDLQSKLHHVENLLTLHQMFIGRLYNVLCQTERLTNHRKFQRVAEGLNAELKFKPKVNKGISQDIEIKPLG